MVVALGLSAVPASAVTGHRYLSQITGFSNPTAVAVDAAGDVYVVDSVAKTVDRFSSTGAPLAFSATGSYIEGSKLTGTPSGAFSFGTGSAENGGIAVDDTNGDVYVSDNVGRVVDVFSSTGEYKSQLTGTPVSAPVSGPFAAPQGLTVDQSTHDLYVTDPLSGVVDVFSSEGSYLSQFGFGVLKGAFGESVAVNDLTQNVYVGDSGNGIVDVFSPTGEYLPPAWTGAGTPNGSFKGNGLGYTFVGMDLTTHLVYVASTQLQVVDELGASVSEEYIGQVTGTPTGKNGLLVPFSRPQAIAVSPANSDLYVADASGVVDIFEPVVVPDVKTATATKEQATSATLTGAVNPEGIQVASCEFEYGTSTAYDKTAPCEHPNAAEIGAGTSPVAVSANVTGLTPSVLYHFRLVAANANGSQQGRDVKFTRPLIDGESASNVLSNDATLSAQVNPLGTQTSYRFEYGTTTAYGTSAPVSDAILGAGSTDEVATQALSGLVPETVYHYRVVVSSAGGNDVGPDRTFSTYPVSGSFQLPDNRAYEMVTSTQKNGLDAFGAPRSTFASPSGDAVAFYATGGLPGSLGAGSTQPRYIAERSGSGWVTHGTQPPSVVNFNPYLQSIFPDLSKVFVQTFEPQLAPGAPAGQYDTYEQDVATGVYTYFPPAPAVGVLEKPTFAVAGVTPDDAHFIFETSSQLLPAAMAGVNNLYEWSDGTVVLVGRLPGANAPAPAAGTVAGAQGGGGAEEYTQTEHALSDDGSRVFFTDPGTGNLYVREGADAAGASTVLVAEAGTFQAATADGSLVFFTKSNEAHSDLYVYNLATKQTSDIAPNGNLELVVGAEAVPRGGVLGVGGGAGDAYVYFAGEGALTGAAVAGQPNIYVAHYDGTNWTTSYITTLDLNGKGADNSDLDSANWTKQVISVNSIEKVSRVTSDGRNLLFRSVKSLTGYDNRGHSELYLYDATSGRLTCVSCAPSGAVGEAETFLEDVGASDGLQSRPGATSPEVPTNNLSADGARVFFDTEQSLLPQDTNGVTDVYEWERGGAGSCMQASGCLFLLSTGKSTIGSFFADASESGGDVFIFTQQQLVPEDQDELQDIYDVRVDGGVVRVAEPACSGTGCQGVPPAPPIFATPSSATFGGIGNFTPLPAIKKGGKAGSRPVRCKRGFVRKRGKCARQRSKRHAKSNRRGK